MATREAGIPVGKVYDELSPEAQMKMMMDAKDMSGMLYDEFEEINGGLLCRQLRGDMMLTCAKYVTDVIGILPYVLHLNYGNRTLIKLKKRRQNVSASV